MSSQSASYLAPLIDVRGDRPMLTRRRHRQQCQSSVGRGLAHHEHHAFASTHHDIDCLADGSEGHAGWDDGEHDLLGRERRTVDCR